jgi:hypothetical protein
MKIITVVVNNVDFIEIQYYTLKKYFQGEYEFIVFNDAKDFPDYTNYSDVTIKSNIENKCRELNINCINIPNEHHKTVVDASVRTANSMNFMLNYQLQNPDKYLILDSDMFLIDYLDINKYSNYDCAILLQNRTNNNEDINYIWHGLCYFDMYKLNNMNVLNWNSCAYCDTGGMTKDWLKLQLNNLTPPTTDNLRWSEKPKTFHIDTTYFIRHLWSTSWNIKELPEMFKENKELINFLQNDTRNKDDKFFCEIYDDVFLHYRAGCNWLHEGHATHNNTTSQLKKVLIG